MKYAEIIIGPPGSGKSTYVMNKKTWLSHRSPYTINLDPGNSNSKEFDYSICSISSSSVYQEKHDVGPNMSTKCILEEFVTRIDEFFRENIEDTDHYVLIDFPGQVEFFISSDIPNRIIRYLKRNGYSVVVLNLIDLVFFSNSHSLVSSYLISTLCLCLLESAQINIISKCDNWKSLEMEYPLEEIASLECLEEIPRKKKLYSEMISFVLNQGLLLYEILDYDNPDSVLNLQVGIDRASGLFFEDNYFDTEKITRIPSRDEVFSKYKS
ncbi:putative ATP binding protein [Encephalitozoon intestinalis ATCC 50506]|uniref:GPN-loop GTPase 3 n=1 Tax=Encephalitozoon intestinalis (strain ATCC 50506) TaxID=876142 RepID=E0S7Q2_ENCIT|nr:putative ATP binding protein [Encephalitozoon intestinalis ATCC 50506]ADM11731.1 putative ATP binding protein [Encephalitozoon intestinalis ATCC 50506]UTX45470.1 GPN-loop GTPase 2 [Encephalitozoon intestinalis]